MGAGGAVHLFAPGFYWSRGREETSKDLLDGGNSAGYVLCANDIDGGESDCKVCDSEEGVHAESVPAVCLDEVLQALGEGRVRREVGAMVVCGRGRWRG